MTYTPATQDQLLAIHVSATGVQCEGISDAPNIMALRDPLLKPMQAHGAHGSQPVLVCAEPGTGKTWSSVQLAHELSTLLAGRAVAAASEGPAPPPTVVMLVYVQRLARMLKARPPDAAVPRMKKPAADLMGSPAPPGAVALMVPSSLGSVAQAAMQAASQTNAQTATNAQAAASCACCTADA